MQYRAPLVLGMIGLIAAGTLALLSLATRDKIAQIQVQSRLAAFRVLLIRSTDMPVRVSESLNEIALRAMARGRPVEDSQFVQNQYDIPEMGEIPKLYILQLTGRGFGGPLELLAAYRLDGSLYHAVMLANSETLGFGKKAEDPTYMKMFWDKGSNIPTSQRELAKSQLDAVTGSTISFRAISTTLLAGANWLAKQ